MIDYIRGICTYAEGHTIVVETGGVGYQIHVSHPYAYTADEEQTVQVFTYQYVREDVLALYGFSSREERSLFISLLQVSGVGPKAAAAILSGGTPGSIVQAIQREDVVFLTSFQGIGKKTAQRIVIDLKDKLDGFASDVSAGVGGRQPDAGGSTEDSVSQADQEAVEALLALGYAEKEVKRIHPVLREKATEGVDTQQLIRLGLQRLMKS